MATIVDLSGNPFSIARCLTWVALVTSAVPLACIREKSSSDDSECRSGACTEGHGGSAGTGGSSWGEGNTTGGGASGRGGGSGGSISGDAGEDQGGSDGSNNEPIGAPCTGDEDCPGGLCVSATNEDETPTGWEGGYCIADCTLTGGVCPANAACYEIGAQGQSACFATCEQPSQCRTGYVCAPVVEGMHRACTPHCGNPGIACVSGAVCTSEGLCGVADGSLSPFVQISAGAMHTCGLRQDGTISCWGANHLDFDARNDDYGYGQCDAPSGTFLQVAAGGFHTCALREDQTITCWGRNSQGETLAPTGTFTHVSAGGAHNCGLRTDGTIACWGANGDGQLDAPIGTFIAVTAGRGEGYTHSCAIDEGGNAVCWGRLTDDPYEPPAGTFVAISGGVDFTCAIDAEASLKCWGLNYQNQLNEPSGAFTQLSTGGGTWRSGTYDYAYACAIGVDGDLACWGDDVPKGSLPLGKLSQVASGGKHACTLDDQGRVACWGERCFPGTRGCATDASTGFCNEQAKWEVETECVAQACVEGECTGECTPAPASCQGTSATTCSATGVLETAVCEYGCIPEIGCATSFRECDSECAILTCDAFGSCTCEGGTVIVCSQRVCETHENCGTLGYCDSSGSGSPVCRERESCSADTCQNGGTCVDGEFSYTCECAEGFVGRNCETDLAACEGFSCGDGYCISVDWVCDGFADCSDESDEADCAPAEP